MPNNNTNRNRNRSGHPHDSRPALVDPFNGDNYVVGAGYNNNNNHGHQPDSPSAFSQLTTATRRDDGFGDDYDGPVVIRVIAPATLQEGYEFDVLVDDEPYTVRVPKGGVKENQEFEIDYDPEQEYKYNNHNSTRRMEQLIEEDDDRNESEGYSQQQQQQQRSQKSSSHTQQQQKTGGTKKMNKMMSARIYDDGSECTEDNENENENENENKDMMKDLEKTHTYPARSLSGDDDDVDEEEDTHLAPRNHAKAGEVVVDKEETENDEDDPKIWYDENGTPIGGWRTRLCSCCDVLTQSTFWMGFCCTPILMAQLITRLGLTWNGREGSLEEASLSYNRLILALVFTLTIFWIPLMGGFFLSIYYIVVIVCIGSKVRGHMRQKYKIPSTLPTRCGDRIDDVCLMLCCGCCSSIQMARHTHDDKDYPGHGCTTTGLEFDAPEMV
jgi:Cys-rich protein (TIGR01571 family)